MNTQKLLFLALVFSIVALTGLVISGGRWQQNEQQLVEQEQTAVSWLTAVQNQIEQTEYQISWQPDVPVAGVDAAYHAPNRAHDLRAYFTADGIQVQPRRQASWRWGMTLTQIGDGTVMRPVAPANISAVGNRVVYERGDLVEWYVNDNRGIEQGFIVQARPQGAAADVLVLDLALSGDLLPAISATGDALEFATADGRYVLRYSDLYAYDAQERPLAAEMDLVEKDGASVVQLTVDTTAAAYPIVIDPLTTTPDWEAGIVQNANFGVDVNSAGDVNGDGYDDVVVGANWYDGGQVDEGAIFVYFGSATGLNTVYDWKAESNVVNREAGLAVDGAGDVNNDGYDDLIVGSKADTAALFLGGPGTPAATAAWTENGPAGSAFGTAVAGAGDVNADGFDDVIVGAPQATNAAGTVVGRAFVYYGSSAGLPTAANWRAESDLGGANFGISVASAGDVNGDNVDDVIVGADKYVVEGVPGAAAVYYGASGSGLQNGPLASINDADWLTTGTDGSGYGFAVGGAGDVNGDGGADVIIGAPTEIDDQLGIQPGAFYLYVTQPDGSGFSLPISPLQFVYGENDGDLFGFDVSTAGDINRDGFDDVIVGAPDHRPVSGVGSEGGLYIFLGTDDGGIISSPAWTLTSAQDGARFGHTVSDAGDVNGDLFADVIVGAPAYQGGLFGDGRAFGFHGTGAITGLTAVNSGPVTEGAPVVFRAQTTSPDSGLNSFTWDFGDSTLGSGQETLHTYTKAGVYTATVTADNPFSSIVASTVVSVTKDAPITPGEGGELSYTDDQGRGTTVNVPSGAVKRPLTLQYTPVTDEPNPPQNTINYYFDLEADLPTVYLPVVMNGSGSVSAAAGGTAVASGLAVAGPQPENAAATCPAGHFCFEKPVTITITYNEDLLNGQDETELRLKFWDEVEKIWVDAAETCDPVSEYQYDPDNDQFSVDICHISRFGVVGA